MEEQVDNRGGSIFDYDVAFARNRGLVSAREQNVLSGSTVAVAGVGGVGGLHAITLARMGIGHVRLIDPDTFDVANFNRQHGANIDTLGRLKATVAQEQIQQINPLSTVSASATSLCEDNVDGFVHGANVVIDGLDFFALDARLTLFAACRRHRIPVVTSGPLGMSATLHIFTPDGMSFDRYFDLRPGMSRVDLLVAFLVGVAPRMTHMRYMDMSEADVGKRHGPSLAPACMLAAGVVGVEVLRLVLGRPRLRAAPHYYQFDAYRHELKKGRLLFGNRGPLQRLKRMIAKRLLLRSVKGFGELALGAGNSKGTS